MITNPNVNSTEGFDWIVCTLASAPRRDLTGMLMNHPPTNSPPPPTPAFRWFASSAVHFLQSGAVWHGVESVWTLLQSHVIRYTFKMNPLHIAPQAWVREIIFLFFFFFMQTSILSTSLNANVVIAYKQLSPLVSPCWVNLSGVGRGDSSWILIPQYKVSNLYMWAIMLHRWCCT